MIKRSPIDQLDLAIDALLARKHAAALTGEAAHLAKVASLLRDLPRVEFRAQLASQLSPKKKEKKMPAVAKTRKPQTARKPVGHPTVVPYIAVVEAREVIDFVQKAFGATGSIMGTGSQGGIHSEYRIGDATLMIGGGEEWRNPEPRPVYLHIYVDDADAAYARAIAAGATSLMPPGDRPYGDREAGVRDIGGNTWWIGQLRNRPRPAGMRDVTLAFEVRGAAAFIDFLKAAFAANEVLRHEEPGGTIRHAQVRIGDTCVELGEAHGPWQPMKTTIFLTVPDCEGTYERALRAGATSVSPPQDTPYGLHMATVSDAFENTWYITTPPAPRPSSAKR
jgi:PhnB protein